MDVRFQPGPGGTSYLSTLHLSNRRAKYTSAMYIRPPKRGQRLAEPLGAGYYAGWAQAAGTLREAGSAAAEGMLSPGQGALGTDTPSPGERERDAALDARSTEHRKEMDQARHHERRDARQASRHHDARLLHNRRREDAQRLHNLRQQPTHKQLEHQHAERLKADRNAARAKRFKRDRSPTKFSRRTARFTTVGPRPTRSLSTLSFQPPGRQDPRRHPHRRPRHPQLPPVHRPGAGTLLTNHGKRSCRPHRRRHRARPAAPVANDPQGELAFYPPGYTPPGSARKLMMRLRKPWRKRQSGSNRRPKRHRKTLRANAR